MSSQLDPDDDLTAFDLPLSTEPADVVAEINAAMIERQPGWAPLPGHPITHLIGAVAEAIAASRDAAQTRFRANIVDLLGLLFRIPRSDGSPASSTITLTATDDQGHSETGPLPAALGDIEMEIPTDVVIPAGATQVTVPVVAVEFGATANGASGTPDISALDWLAETDPVVLDSPLAGGQAPEDDGAYFVRMLAELQTRSDALILPRDYTTSALRHPGVAYAWTLPHYRAAALPADDDPAAVFHVTTIAAGADGGPISTGTRLEVEADFAERLLDNVVHHLVDPIPRAVSVTTQVARRPGFDSADVHDTVVAHLADVLNPATYAAPRSGDDPNPMPNRVIHKNELVARVDELDSVNYPVSLQIGDGSSDRVVLGIRELPTPGTITVTVVDA